MQRPKTHSSTHLWAITQLLAGPEIWAALQHPWLPPKLNKQYGERPLKETALDKQALKKPVSCAEISHVHACYPAAIITHSVTPTHSLNMRCGSCMLPRQYTQAKPLPLVLSK